MTVILITGGAGFIGSHMVEHFHRKTDWTIIILDKLSYATKGLSRLRDSGLLLSHRVHFFSVDLVLPISDGIREEIKNIGKVDYFIHMAAETHVDNSIKDPVFVVETNVKSTLNILEFARQEKPLKFFYFSTDEVFGSAPKNVSFKETCAHNPTNPYSASKSAAEMICIAYENTFRIPLIIVNVMNAFGERQYIEKFIPKCIKAILTNTELEIHCDEKGEAGSRSYIHARNIASSIMFLIDKGVLGEKYNIVGEQELDNLSLAKKIEKIIQKTIKVDLKYKKSSNPESRPGHDLRYALDGTKMKNIGWVSPVGFDESLENTILWTLKHQKWLEE